MQRQEQRRAWCEAVSETLNIAIEKSHFPNNNKKPIIASTTAAVILKQLLLLEKWVISAKSCWNILFIKNYFYFWSKKYTPSAKNDRKNIYAMKKHTLKNIIIRVNKLNLIIIMGNLSLLRRYMILWRTPIQIRSLLLYRINKKYLIKKLFNVWLVLQRRCYIYRKLPPKAVDSNGNMKCGHGKTIVLPVSALGLAKRMNINIGATNSAKGTLGHRQSNNDLNNKENKSTHIPLSRSTSSSSLVRVGVMKSKLTKFPSASIHNTNTNKTSSLSSNSSIIEKSFHKVQRMSTYSVQHSPSKVKPPLPVSTSTNTNMNNSSRPLVLSNMTSTSARLNK